MFTKRHRASTRLQDAPRVNWRAVGVVIGDAVGVIAIFATAYLLLLIGHGFGLN